MIALRTFLATLVTLLAPCLLVAQGFDQTAYQRYLKEIEGLSVDGLETRFPAGLFSATARSDWRTALHADSVEKYYALTDYERSLIARHGFMVTERKRWPTFGQAFSEVYARDLPVFVSTDAILHAVHMSYDRILKELEKSTLRPQLDTALAEAQARLRTIAGRYGSDGEMASVVAHVDVYLSVVRSLLQGSRVAPINPANEAERNALLDLAYGESAATIPLFGGEPRMVDFSQFRPRGHYTEDPELETYFRAMMWLGRIELYLDIPTSVVPPVPPDDCRHQAAMSALLAQALYDSPAGARIDGIDRTIRSFVGDQDNVSGAQMAELLEELAIADPAQLLDSTTYSAFVTLLRSKPYSGQRILSQMLQADPFDDEPIQPASAMMPLGQRFIMDSYILSNVVFDKTASCRMLPSSLDALFALGNDAAAQLLEPELQAYGYASNLAGMRYVVDTYDTTYWSSTIYGGWLNAIRTLAPPRDRTALPPFMRTAAWWQEKINTQLASWAQLRHDNLLYAKQSYSGMAGCSYPHSLVEPIPEFYAALGAMARNASAIMRDVDSVGQAPAMKYFSRLAETCQTLEDIARRQLAGAELTDEQRLFLSRMLYTEPAGCTSVPAGWYVGLYYDWTGGDVFEQDLVIADIHTAPSDCAGNITGWVKHVGTGLLDMAVVLYAPEGGETVAYVGPVMSYRERTTSNFRRMTDEEWENEWEDADVERPSLVNLYLAGKDGGPRGATVSLHTEVTSVPAEVSTTLFASVHPNPAAGVVTIDFAVPPARSGAAVTLEIIDATGRIVATPVAEALPEGAYQVRWPTTGSVPTGAYTCRLRIADDVSVTRFVLVEGE